MKLGCQPINWQAEFSLSVRRLILDLPVADCVPLPKLSPEEKKVLMEEQLKKLEQQEKSPQKN